MTTSSYFALALQSSCDAVNQDSDRSSARARMMASIQRIGRELAASKAFIGPDVRLVVLPEYALTGFPMGEDAATWRDKAAIDPDGPEYEALGKIAQAQNVFVSINAYETDPHFPTLYFQASVVIAPSGDTVLRYRRLISMYAPSPYDVLSAYIEAYGEDAIFPVARTEIGNLAAIASEEILYPEIARAHAMRGAEVFLHSSSEVSSRKDTSKNIAKQARAIENLAYLVSANSAGIVGTPIPEASTDGSSKIIDPRGLILAEAANGPSMVANAEIDLEALRRMRRRVSMGNLLARQPAALYAQAYGAADIHPRESLMIDGDVQTPDRSFYKQRQLNVIEKLADKGLI